MDTKQYKYLIIINLADNRLLILIMPKQMNSIKFLSTFYISFKHLKR